MTDDKREGEIISFGKVVESHMYTLSERKLKKAQKAFKAVIRKKFKQDRIEARKKKKRKKR